MTVSQHSQRYACSRVAAYYPSSKNRNSYHLIPSHPIARETNCRLRTSDEDWFRTCSSKITQETLTQNQDDQSSVLQFINSPYLCSILKLQIGTCLALLVFSLSEKMGSKLTCSLTPEIPSPYVAMPGYSIPALNLSILYSKHYKKRANKNFINILWWWYRVHCRSGGMSFISRP